MPTLKGLINNIRLDLSVFLSTYPDDVSEAAFLLATTTFKKTLFTSHIHFLSRCLRYKVIPKGFEIKFHSIARSTLIKKHLYDCSRNLIRSTITDFNSTSSGCTRLLPTLVNRLKFLCRDFNHFLSIRRKIHELNQSLFDYLKTTKDSKFQRILKEQRPDFSRQSESSETVNNVRTIPEDLPLDEHERSVLNKNLKFVPLKPTIDEFQTWHDADTFFRRLLLKAFFHDQPDNHNTSTDNNLSPSDVIDKLFRQKSTWTPQSTKYQALELYIAKCKHEISKINFNQRLNYSNLSPSEFKALRRLKSRQDIVIKPADKGGCVVVWRKDLYIKEGNSQLNNPTSYEAVNKDPTKSFNYAVTTTIQDEIKSGNLPPNATKLYSSHPRTSVFYMLPKIHKLNNPGRPIVSAVSCPTSQIASLLDYYFTPLVQKLPSYVKDSSDTLRIINNFQFTGANKFLFSMDVKSLYTVIPHQDGLIALKYFLDQRSVLDPPTNTLLRLAEHVLTTNAFSFDDKFYKQLSGVAMGSILGPSYACLFVGYQEKLIFESYDGPIPELFKRFIDDIFGATSLSFDQLSSFIDFVNNFHPALEFTYSITHLSLSFLDLLLTIFGNSISSTIFYKETDSHNYLNYTSSHPPSCKNSIPYSQFLRLRRLCSDDDDFRFKLTEMRKFFVSSGYPTAVLDNALSRISTVSRHDALLPVHNQTTTDRVPLVITYHPLNHKIKNIILNNFKILLNDSSTKAIFNNPPLVAFRRDNNLRNILVKSKLSSDELPGSFPCTHGNCKTCRHINRSTKIQTTSSSITIKSHFTCSSSCIIYCIRCTKCNLLYIGETCRQLNNRFGEHLRNVRNKIHLQSSHLNDADLNISEHFNSSGHSSEEMEICGVAFAPTEPNKRKTLEKRYIFKLGTLSPNGLNKQFSFL